MNCLSWDVSIKMKLFHSATQQNTEQQQEQKNNTGERKENHTGWADPSG